MKSFELTDVDVSSYGNSMKLVIIYRPLRRKRTNIRTLTFLLNLLVSSNIMHSWPPVLRLSAISTSTEMCLPTTMWKVSLIWVTQYHSTCPRSNTHWRSNNWSDPHSIRKSLHHCDKNNVAALRSSLGGMSRRHGETGRSAENNHVPAFCSDIASSLPTAISSGKLTTTELANHYNVVLSKLV